MNKKNKYLGRGHELKQLIGECNSQGGRNQDVVVVEPCPVAAVVHCSLAVQLSARRRVANS